jgi:glutaredoxin
LAVELSRKYKSKDDDCYSDSQQSAMTKATVTIYTRPGCKLCDEAKAVIVASGGDEISIEEVNIDRDSALSEQFGYDIPVVFINGVKVFKHRVDPREFKRKLRRLTRG